MDTQSKLANIFMFVKRRTSLTPPFKNRPHPTMATPPWLLENPNPTGEDELAKSPHLTLDLEGALLCDLRGL